MALLVGVALIAAHIASPELSRRAGGAFHAGVVWAAERALPPEDPFFAGLPLRHAWGLHAWAAASALARGQWPAGAAASALARGQWPAAAAGRLVQGLEREPWVIALDDSARTADPRWHVVARADGVVLARFAVSH